MGPCSKSFPEPITCPAHSKTAQRDAVCPLRPRSYCCTPWHGLPSYAFALAVPFARKAPSPDTHRAHSLIPSGLHPMSHSPPPEHNCSPWASPTPLSLLYFSPALDSHRQIYVALIYILCQSPQPACKGQEGRDVYLLLIAVSPASRTVPGAK